MKVVIAMYEHRHGTDLRAFSSMEGVDAWREEIAREYWDELKGADDLPDEFNADFYWDWMSDYGDEWFTYDWYEVGP